MIKIRYNRDTDMYTLDAYRVHSILTENELADMLESKDFSYVMRVRAACMGSFTLNI